MFLEANLLDRLQITIAPLLIGDGRRSGCRHALRSATVIARAIACSAWAPMCCSIARSALTGTTPQVNPIRSQR
jgi:hypothetical protein